MKFLALEHELPGVSAEQFQLHARAEALRVWELMQGNILREIYFRADRDQAVLVLECASLAEAEQTLSTLPFVQNKLIRFEIIPLRAYPGLARLFETA